MPSTSEKGHAKNVANFSKLIEVCKGFGAAYNPSKAAIKIANLEAKLLSCNADLENVKEKNQAESTVRNSRKAAFENRKKLSTKLLAAIKSSDASSQSVEDAISINKKIQGERISEKPAAKPATEGATATTPNTISTAQLSYTNIVEHYKKYKTLLTSLSTEYAPNETELQLATIATTITNWESLNKQVDVAETASKNALIKRDKNFYADKTGIPDVALAAKEYVKSLFGAGSPEHKLVTKISFS
jgi:hypothetical protein